MPRPPKAPERTLPRQSLVLDNGGDTIKVGFAGESTQADDCRVVPNCIARDRAKRIWIGSQLENCKDFGEIAFRRPVEKGFLVNWEAEKSIWDNIFLDPGAKLQCDPKETNLLLTQASNAPAALEANCDQIVFEEYEFETYSRHSAASLNAFLDVPHIFGATARNPDVDVEAAECLLLIDSGYSHTTVSPLYKGKPIQQAVRRLDIGGKFLTNCLKEIISIRHYNLNDETYLINQIKEKVCFVSDDFERDLESLHKGPKKSRQNLRNDIVVDYVLPDYNTSRQGFSRPHDSSASAKLRKINSLAGNGDAAEDYMTLGNERFVVPELLFHPRDVGMKQLGLPEMVMASLSGVPTGLWPAMLANTLVVGGNANIPGFINRLESELRQLSPSECKLRVAKVPDPIRSTWLGGCELARNHETLRKRQVTRQEYQENGQVWLSRVFSGATTR